MVGINNKKTHPLPPSPTNRTKPNQPNLPKNHQPTRTLHQTHTTHRHPYSAEIVFRPNTADDPSRRKPDITRMRETFGWEPKVPLREGLARMVDDFKRRLQV